MDRVEVAGAGIALVGHGALLAALTFGLALAGNPMPVPAPMEVSFVEEVGQVSSSPAPMPAAASRAPEIGPIEDAAAPGERVPPEPLAIAREAAPAPAPAQRPAQRPEARTRRPGLGDLDPRSFGRDPASRAKSAPAATMSAAAAADIASVIARQVQPCADRQVYPGPGAERIVTPVILRLNRDGSLDGRPRVGRQRGLDDENRRYADRVADLAVAAFVGCVPLRGLPQDLYDVPRGWSNFTFNYRLPG